MKKVIATSLAFTVLLGLSACGGRSDDAPIEKPSPVSAHTSEPTTSDVVEYDPFEEFSISSANGVYPYPSDLDIEVKGLNNQYFNIKIESADTETIELKTSIDIEKFREYAESHEWNYRLTKEEQTYTLSASELPHYCYNKSDFTEKVILDSEKRIQDSLNLFKYDSDRKLIGIYASVLKPNSAPFLVDYDYFSSGDITYETETGYDTNRFRTWYLFEMSDGKYCIPSNQPVVKNSEVISSIYDVYEMPLYDTEEEAIKAIEDNISQYDNVQLEELTIPDSLK